MMGERMNTSITVKHANNTSCISDMIYLQTKNSNDNDDDPDPCISIPYRNDAL